MRAFRVIFWSFFGVRKRADWHADAETLKPAEIIIAALVSTALFVLGLVLLIKWIVK